MGFYSFSIFSLFQDNTCINTQRLRMFSMANKNCSNPLSSSIKMVKKKLSSSSYCKIADTSNSEVYSFSLAKILDCPPWICLWVFCPPESSSLEGKRFVSFFPSFPNWDCWALETVLTVLDPVWCLLLWPTGECTFYTNGLFCKWKGSGCVQSTVQKALVLWALGTQFTSSILSCGELFDLIS